MLKCHLRETNTCVIHRSPLAGAHKQPVAHRTGHAIALTDKTPKTWLSQSEKAAICLLENPCCRHSVHILKPHKTVKTWVVQPSKENPIPCRARFCSAGKRPPLCISCRCCRVFIQLCSPQWEPAAVARAVLGNLPLLHPGKTGGFRSDVSFIDFHTRQGTRRERSNRTKLLHKQFQDGTIRNFQTFSHPPCPCTEDDTTQITQKISE